MKTIEEKSKAYDEAIKRLRNAFYDNNGRMCEEYRKAVVRIIEPIFPELKENESEDEKIRKNIISWLKNIEGQTIPINDYNSAIAWLEKPGEQKSNDKVEFEIGDLITNGILVGEIDEIHELGYHAYFGDHYADVPDIENWHKWTIQDAKDGDVLVDKSDGTIGIFQSIGHHDDGGSFNDTSYCFLHCRYDDRLFYADFEHGNEMGSDDAIPATKEQRDLLFQKMKEAGYEWDSQNRELKKIDHKELTDFQEGLRGILIESNGKYDDNTVLRLSEQVLELVGQKQEWSKEDEINLEKAIWYVENPAPMVVKDSMLVEWLKSLKDRVQPQSQLIKAQKGEKNMTRKEVENLKEMFKPIHNSGRRMFGTEAYDSHIKELLKFFGYDTEDGVIKEIFDI